MKTESIQKFSNYALLMHRFATGQRSATLDDIPGIELSRFFLMQESFEPDDFKFNPHELDAWACKQSSETLIHAVRFILFMWNPNFEWRTGKFQSGQALASWHEDMVHIFEKWESEPVFIQSMPWK